MGKFPSQEVVLTLQPGREAAVGGGTAGSSWGWEAELTVSGKADGTSLRNGQDAFRTMNK